MPLMRRAIYFTVVWIIILPILPFYLVMEAADAISNGITWLIRDRLLTEWLLSIATRLEAWSLSGNPGRE
jgi:hypothetical protein